MKPTWMIARIVCALVVIFALGIWVGRLTAPREKVAAPPETPAGGMDREWGSPAERQRTIDMVTKRVIPHYQSTLQMSDELVEELRPFFMHAGRQMAKHPPNTEGRMWAVLGFHKRIRPFLDEDQNKALTELGEDVRKRHADLNE